MKIAVTGYRGFIASNLIPELKGEDLSLIEKENYPLAGRIEGTDAIIHLGAIAGARPEVPTYDYFDYNIKRTLDLLEAARQAKTRKFIFISTCTVSHGIKNVYDISKFQAEKWCELYRQYIDDVTILRLYNVYGEGDTKSVIAKFVTAIEREVPIVIHGNGKQARDFIHVKDVIRAIQKALYSKKPLNSVFDVGTGSEKSIIGLANMIFRISRKEVPIKHGPLPYSQLKSARSPKPLFVKDPISLEQGLRRLIEDRRQKGRSLL